MQLVKATARPPVPNGAERRELAMIADFRGHSPVLGSPQRCSSWYAQSDSEDRVYFDHFEGGHRWNGKVAFPVFDKLLQA